jgi:hypothetical protein
MILEEGHWGLVFGLWRKGVKKVFGGWSFEEGLLRKVF